MERTQEIIKLRLEGRLTQREIGEKYGICRERVRQILKLAGITGTVMVYKTYDIICKNCSKQVRSKYHERVFCSRACWNEYAGAHKITPEGKREYNRKKTKEYYHTHPKVIKRNKRKQERKSDYKIKSIARKEVNKALNRGDLIKPTSCPKCGTNKHRIEAHHKDYTKPLEIKWFCTPCHYQEDIKDGMRKGHKKTVLQRILDSF